MTSIWSQQPSQAPMPRPVAATPAPRRRVVRTTRGIAAAVLSGALLLTACGDGGAGFGSSATDIANLQSLDYNPKSRDEIRDGGTLTTAIDELSPQQNPFHADSTAYSSEIYAWYNPILFRTTEDEKRVPNPDYITDLSVDVVRGNTVLKATFNDKAKFNDGTPIDWRAAETAWIINRSADGPYKPSSTEGWVRISSIRPGKNDKEVVITFNGMYPWADTMLDAIHPKVREEENYNSYLNKLHPEWGAGPYTVESANFKRGTAVFVRNPKWWGNPGKLDKRVFREMDSSAALNAFANGEIDAVGASAKERFAQVSQMPNTDVRKGKATSFRVLTLNSKSPILRDAKVREALMTAVDRSQLEKVRDQGLDYTEELPGSLVTFTYQKGYEDNLGKVVQYDEDKAKALLDEAGWETGADGIRTRGGKTLTLTLPMFDDSPTYVATLKALQAIYRKVGVDLNLVEKKQQFSSVMKNREFDIILTGITAGVADGTRNLGQIYDSASELNKSGTGTPAIDQQLEKLRQMPTREEAFKAGNRIETEYFKGFGIMPVMNGPEIVATKQGLANYGVLGFASVNPEDVGWEK